MGQFKEIDILMREEEFDAEMAEMDRQLLLLDVEVDVMISEAKRCVERVKAQVEKYQNSYFLR